MPVNDSPTLGDAEVNCALCCVAGIIDSTAEQLRGRVRGAMGNVQVGIADTFVEFAFRCCHQQRSDLGKETIRCQVLGVQTWLVQQENRAVDLIGTTENPLQLSVLEERMAAAPDGARFVVLIMDWNDDFNQATSAHWITAAKRQGGAIEWTDYQLDVPQAQVAAMRGHTNRRNAPFGAPHVTQDPREAFADPSRGTNRYMALQITPAPPGGGGTTVKCPCYITTAACRVMGLPDDCFELQTLRRFRDEVLLPSATGAAQVAAYYATAPGLVAALDKREDAEDVYRALFHDFIGPAAQAAARGDAAAAHALFVSGVMRAARLAAAPPDHDD